MATLYVGLVAHAAATSFKAGYLSYFGIDIRSVDYWPSIADFMNEPIIVVGAIIILLALCFGAIVLINGLHWIMQKIAKKKKWKKFLDFIDEKPYGWKLTTGVLIALLLFVSFKIPLYDSYGRGIEAAKKQTSFVVINSDSDSRQALIYQYNDLGLFKTYNPGVKQFNKDYETLDLKGKSFEYLKLDIQN